MMIMANEKKKQEKSKKETRKKQARKPRKKQERKQDRRKKESKKETRTEWKSVSQNNNKKQKENLTVFKSCATLPIICLISNACILSIAFS
jgi:predicted metalloprotease